MAKYRDLSEYGGMMPTRSSAGFIRRSGIPEIRGVSPTPSFPDDPRLRGLTPEQLRGSPLPDSTTLAGRAYSVMTPDPYAEVVRRELEIGRRLPRPYQAPTALAGRRLMPTEYYESNYQPLDSERAIYPAADIAGRRSTLSGTFGQDIAQPMPWSAREQMGYTESRSRGPGLSSEWDTQTHRERMSGKVSAPGTFSQRVDPRYPFFHVMAKGDGTGLPEGYASAGNARVKVTVGRFETGGATTSREFYVGGGFTGFFDLQGWDQLTFEVVYISPGTVVEFSWTTTAIQAGNKTLYYLEVLHNGVGSIQPVPEGAYSVIVNKMVGWTSGSFSWWTDIGGIPTSLIIRFDDGTTGLVNQFGTPIPVAGTMYAPPVIVGGVAGQNVPVLWNLRPI